MLASLVSAAAAYAGTNIDDIFVLMLLLAQCRAPEKLVCGHFLGVGAITALSLLGALGLQNLPLQYVGLLGIVPIVLGIRAWRQYKKGSDDNESPTVPDAGVLGMAATTLGNGADNIGVYIPLFTGFTGVQRLIAVLVFAVLTALWLWLAKTLASRPRIQALIEKYRHIAVPMVFISLGVYILLESCLPG